MFGRGDREAVGETFLMETMLSGTRHLVVSVAGWMFPVRRRYLNLSFYFKGYQGLKLEFLP